MFPWIIYKPCRDRDRINKQAMADLRLKHISDPQSPLFDGKRMFFAGFKEIVEF